jgi:hypothetical protein
MKSTCDTVVERVALGEALGELAEHAASCERCRRLVALPVELGAVHRELDPGLGFTARMTAGAQHRIAVRRRRRITGALAVAVAASVVGVLVMTREQPAAEVSTRPTPAAERPKPAQDAPASEASDDEMQELVKFANVDRALHQRADWKSIEEPLAPYRELLEGKIEP